MTDAGSVSSYEEVVVKEAELKRLQTVIKIKRQRVRMTKDVR